MSAANAEWLTLETEVHFDAKDVPLVALATAVEGRFPGLTAIPSARAYARVSMQAEKVRFADLLEQWGLIVMERQ